MNIIIFNKYSRLFLFAVIIFAVSFSVNTHAYSSDNESEPPLFSGFSALKMEGLEPFTAQFKDITDKGEVSSWFWDFGDETSSTVQNPVHTFNDPGDYRVVLSVKYKNGEEARFVKENFIKVLKRSNPLAEFSATPVSGKCPLVVDFTDESKGDNLSSWMWDFGNGNSSSEQNPVVKYRTPGIFTVKLVISNSLGANVQRKVNYIVVTDN